ncbi:MAG: hypothetical protein RI841_14740 [Halomonas sp.]|uniref:hypothetical protein n=1 Tax=Halomonas sp. TaxID=1486246 RepID=UPI0028704A70|nr:hypothetical protein [Halomonas sp.]MDR9440735.1 hypothetical protein [Halomonas sp.]
MQVERNPEALALDIRKAFLDFHAPGVELGDYNVAVDVFDPPVNKAEAEAEYGIRPVAQLGAGAMILAVAHRAFRELGVDGIRAWGKPEHVFYDLKYLLPKESVDLRL